MTQLSAEALQWKQRAEERQAKIVELEALLDYAERYIFHSATVYASARMTKLKIEKMRDEFAKKAGLE